MLKLAVCGKGGSGKTALVALIIKYLIKTENTKILAVDADPTMNLAGVIGLRIGSTINDIREEIIKTARSKGPQKKNEIARSLDYMMLEAVTEADRFHLLVMGRPESLGCYCPVNELLRSGIKSLSEHYDVIIIDGEAGIEQMNRQVFRSIDIPIIISDMSRRGLETASLINTVLESHTAFSYKMKGFILNRVPNDFSSVEKHLTGIEIELLGTIPEDSLVAAFDFEARPLLEIPDDSPAYKATERIMNRIII
jgi:CO dehydrogenase maturation factor